MLLLTNSSLKTNFVLNIILTLCSFIFPLITFPYISRILLPVGTGKVSFAISFVSYFNMIAQLGIPTYGIRECAKVRDDREKLSKLSQELLFINLIMSLFSYVVFIGCLILIPRLSEDRTLLLIASITIFLNAIGMEWLFKALERYAYITVRSVAIQAVALCAMFALIHKQSDYIIYGGIAIFASSAANILNFIQLRKFITLRPLGNYDFKRHLKPMFIFFAMTCATTVYTNLDNTMLGFMTTDTDVGYYDAAVKIKTILLSIVTSLGVVLLPRSSYFVEHNLMDEFKKVSGKALEFVFLLATPLAVYFSIFAREGLVFLSGKAYEPATLPMIVVMPTILFIGITNMLGMQMLVPLGRENIVLYSVIGGAVVDLVLNSILIPKYASTGAAVGTLVAEIVVLVIQYMYMRRDYQSMFSGISYWKVLPGLLLGSLCSWWVKGLNVLPFWQLVISAIIFFVIYGVSLVLLKEQLVTELLEEYWEKFKNKFMR